MPELREATRRDHADVQRLHAQHTGKSYLPMSSYESWLGKCTLAVEDGTVLGFSFGNHDSGAWGNILVTPEPPENWNCSYLTHLVVDQGHRRQRVGSLLLQDFLDQTRLAGNSWVILNPGSQAEGQTEADLHAFYEANGFLHLRHRPDDDAPKGWEVDHYLLGCPVREEERYEVAVLDGPYERPAPPPMPPETAQERDRRKERIAELQRRYGGTADHPLATYQPRGGQRRGW